MRPLSAARQFSEPLTGTRERKTKDKTQKDAERETTLSCACNKSHMFPLHTLWIIAHPRCPRKEPKNQRIKKKEGKKRKEKKGKKRDKLQIYSILLSNVCHPCRVDIEKKQKARRPEQD